MRLTLRPLPDLSFQVVGDRVSFDERLNWLPESDALQNGKGLLFEFSYGQLNATKGEKRLLPAEAFKDAAGVRIERTRNWSVAERLRLAQECRDKLAAYPALTRNAPWPR